MSKIIVKNAAMTKEQANKYTDKIVKEVENTVKECFVGVDCRVDQAQAIAETLGFVAANGLRGKGAYMLPTVQGARFASFSDVDAGNVVSEQRRQCVDLASERDALASTLATLHAALASVTDTTARTLIDGQREQAQKAIDAVKVQLAKHGDTLKAIDREEKARLTARLSEVESTIKALESMPKAQQSALATVYNEQVTVRDATTARLAMLS
jgi:predicted trehalose synthase